MAEKNGAKQVLNRDNIAGYLNPEGILTLVIDTNKRLRPSRPTIDPATNEVKPSKSMIVCSTGGNPRITLGDGSEMTISVNGYVPLTAQVPAKA